MPNWVPYCDTHARGPYSPVKIGEGWGGCVSAERYRYIGFPYDFNHLLRTFRSNSVRIVEEFPMILAGGVGGSGILFIGWVGDTGHKALMTGVTSTFPPGHNRVTVPGPVILG